MDIKPTNTNVHVSFDRIFPYLCYSIQTKHTNRFTGYLSMDDGIDVYDALLTWITRSGRRHWEPASALRASPCL